MFIAHAPAGFILTKAIQQKADTGKYLILGLVASILPDLDMLYFYFIDNKQHMHHTYMTHVPFNWMILAIFCFLIIWFFKKREYFLPASIFFSNIFLHFILDSIVGRIQWLFPVTAKPFFLFDVPALYSHWIYNFLYHWTFFLEIIIILFALILLMQRKGKLVPTEKYSLSSSVWLLLFTSNSI